MMYGSYDFEPAGEQCEKDPLLKPYSNTRSLLASSQRLRSVLHDSTISLSPLNVPFRYSISHSPQHTTARFRHPIQQQRAIHLSARSRAVA